MEDESHELQVRQQSESSMPLLAPVDKGRQAYLVLLGCSLLQLPIWGFSISYGVLQEYYTSSASRLSGNTDLTGVIGTTLTGIIYLSMPFLFGMFTRQYAHLRKHWFVVGLVVSVASLVASAFASKVWHLVATQGVMQAIGATLLYSSSTIYVDEWFVRRKGFAYGVMLSVKSVAGAGTPLLFGYLLSHVGYRTTLFTWAGIVAVISVPAVFLLCPRIPLRPQQRANRNTMTTANATDNGRLSFSFLHHRTFYIFQIANVLFSASYGMPQTYLSSFASNTLGFSPTDSALMLVALTTPSVISSFWFGLLSDGTPLFRRRVLSISSVSVLSALGACLPVFLLWGFVPDNHSSGGVAMVTLFAITYGFFAGGYSATWGGIVREISREAERADEAVDTGLVYGLLNGGRGVGYMLGGFVGVQLLKVGSVVSDTEGLGEAAMDTHWAYASKYGGVILFTGLGAAMGGVSVLLRRK